MRRKNVPQLGIFLERTVQDPRPGRWMPVVWILFACLLAGGITTAIHFFGPAGAHPAVANSTANPTASPAVSASPLPSPSPQGELALLRPSDTISRGVGADAELKEFVDPARAVSPTRDAPPADSSPVAVPEILDVGLPAAAEPAAGRRATLTAAVKLELRRQGHVTGIVYLKPGQKVDVISHEGGGMVRVRWKDAEGFAAEQSLGRQPD